MTLISCLVKRVCLHSSSNLQGAAFSLGVSAKEKNVKIVSYIVIVIQELIAKKSGKYPKTALKFHAHVRIAVIQVQKKNS